MALPVRERGLDDPREPLGPIIAAFRDQPHALAVALHAEAVAVELNLVEPLGRGGDNIGTRWQTKLKFHWADIGLGHRFVNIGTLVGGPLLSAMAYYFFRFPIR
jgi:hypothetical protein